VSDEAARVNAMLGIHGNDETQLISVICHNDDADDDDTRSEYQFICQARLTLHSNDSNND